MRQGRLLPSDRLSRLRGGGQINQERPGCPQAVTPAVLDTGRLVPFRKFHDRAAADSVPFALIRHRVRRRRRHRAGRLVRRAGDRRRGAGGRLGGAAHHGAAVPAALAFGARLAACSSARERPRPGRWFRIRWIREAVNSMLPVAQLGGNIVGIRLLVHRGVPGPQAGAGTTLDLTIEASDAVVVHPRRLRRAGADATRASLDAPGCRAASSPACWASPASSSRSGPGCCA